MERWWTDPDQAATVLTFVDDSDVVHGVSTAFLGYHGLAEGVLRPLAQQTLVDGEVISEALQDVDLEPVAKALGEATRPVLGDKSAAYGQLLAKQFHDDAVESTTRFVTNLVSTGMPWPTAVERAASVHGIPVQRLGKAGSQLRAPVVAKASAADVADRALMEFAAHVGIREDARDVVSKMERERTREREFDENDVNRDQKGRFAPKASSSLSGMSQEMINQDRQKRMERMRRRRERRQKQMSQMRSKGKSLAQLRQQGKSQERVTRTALTSDGQAVAEAAEADIQRAIDAKVDEAIEAKTNAAIEAKVAEAREKAVQAAVDDFLKNRNNAPDMDGVGSLLGIPDTNVRDAEGYYPGVLVRSPLSEQKYVLINRHLMNEIVSAEGFNWQKLVASGATNGVETLDKDGLRFVVDEISGRFNDDDDLDDFAVLAIDGPIAYNTDFTLGREEIPAPAGNYYVQNSDDSGVGDPLDLGLKVRESPGSKHRMSYDMPFVMVSLDNEDDFRSSVGKMWNEAEVNRDAQGRFSDKPGGSGPRGRLREVDPDKAARQARMARRRRRMQRQQAQLKQMQSRSVSLAQLRTREQTTPQTKQAPETSQQETLSDSAMEQLLEAQMNEAVEAKVQEAIDARVQEAIDAKVKEAIARNEKRAFEFKNKHQAANDDLKFTQAVVFDPDEDAQLLSGVFGYDPYDKGFDADLVVTDPGFRANAFEYGKSPVPSRDAASMMHSRAVRNQERGNRRFIADDPEPVTMPDGNPIVTTLTEAQALATDAANEKNRMIDSRVERFVGFAQRRRSIPGDDRAQFEPMVVAVPIEETDIVVLGSDEDWVAARQGKNVTLQPVAGFDAEPDDPGLGSFDHLFGEIADDEEWMRQTQSPARSDFYVRAFRIKR